jgi:hypothetical protein
VRKIDEEDEEAIKRLLDYCTRYAYNTGIPQFYHSIVKA